MPELVITQRTPEWHAARLGKITASVAAGCLGLDPYTSRQRAWRSILGTEKQPPNRHMQWGVQFEAAARLNYETDTGEIVTETGFWVHPTLDWLGASPDGLIGDDGLDEIKCPTVPPERVPRHHLIQMLIQLEVTGRAWCDYYSWGASGKKFAARVRRRNIQPILDRLHWFYLTYVVPQIEPERKGSKAWQTRRTQMAQHFRSMALVTLA